MPAPTTVSSPTPHLSHRDVGIPPRQIDFPMPQTGHRHAFYDGNPLASLLFVVFSAVFPPGERFFMESVRHFRHHIQDPVLKAQISGFMGQEALHGREHDRLNAHLAAQGFDVAAPARYVQFGLRQLQRFSPRMQLACTTMMEHFTAHLAQEWLTDEVLGSSTPSQTLQLWHWHALEELEHKSVAYDVFEAVGGTREERLRAVWLVGLFVMPAVVLGWLRLWLQDAQLLNLRENRRGWRVLFGPQGLISKILRKMPRYWREGFHPSQQNTQALQTAWQDKLFGRHGELLAMMRKPGGAASKA